MVDTDPFATFDGYAQKIRDLELANPTPTVLDTLRQERIRLMAALVGSRTGVLQFAFQKGFPPRDIERRLKAVVTACQNLQQRPLDRGREDPPEVHFFWGQGPIDFEKGFERARIAEADVWRKDLCCKLAGKVTDALIVFNDAWRAMLPTQSPKLRNDSSPVRDQRLGYLIRIESGGTLQYKVQFRDEEGVIKRLNGLQMFEHLMKQPGKRASSLDVNRVVTVASSPRRYVKTDEISRNETDGDAGLGYSTETTPKEPADNAAIAAVQGELQKHQRFLTEAQELQDDKREKKEEEAVRKLQSWLKEQAHLRRTWRSHQPASDSPSEKARKRWDRNRANAIKHLRATGFAKLAQHFEDHIKPHNNGWVYVPDPTIEWRFT